MATKKSKPPTNRLAEIVAYRRSQGSGVTGAIAGGLKERLKEKFDPRQLINQKGLLTALFPGLKTYAAKTASAEKLSKSSIQSASLDEIKPVLETISYNTKMTAKNTMVLPAMHRDVNVIRQNMVKLVKLRGGDARTKADMFFVNAKEREEKYERELKKVRNNQNNLQKQKNEEDKKKSKGILGFLGKIFSTIINGLKSIVGAILDLGKAIFGAFKLLAEVVIDVIGKALSLALAPLKLLGSVIKDFFIDFFKTTFIKTLFKSFVARVIVGVIASIFSKTFLFRLAKGMIVTIAAMLGIKYMSFSEQENRIIENKGKPLSGKEEIRRLEEIEKYQTLPTDEKEKGKSVIGDLDTGEKRQSWLKSKESFMGKIPFLKDFFGDITSTFNKEILDEFLEFKRTFYSIRIPGLQAPYGEGLYSGHNFFLTQKEAAWWGNSQTELKRLFGQLNALDNKQNKTSEDLNKAKNITEQIKILKESMLAEGQKLVNEQIQNSDLRQSYIGAINQVLHKKYSDVEDNVLRNIKDDITNMPFIKEGMEDVQKSTEDYFNKNFKLPYENMENRGLQLFDESKQLLMKRVEEFSSANKNLSTQTKTRAVEVITNNTNNNNTVSSSEEVAPAWNMDYFENIEDSSIIGIK
jgi:hypothetical protein